MKRLTENKIVLVTRPTRLGELVARFNTVAQARFYVEHLGADFSDYQREDENYRTALRQTQTVLESLGRLQVVGRAFVPNFVFGPHDTVVTLGQDGLVANTLKYLHGQPIVGVNPDPTRWDGELLPFRVEDLETIVPEVFAGKRATKEVTMAKATLNNMQSIYAVNDLFIGPRSHVSARYTIQTGEVSEAHSSSGVIVSTGLGSTGWFRSLLAGATAVSQSASALLSETPGTPPQRKTHAQRPGLPQALPQQPMRFAWDANYLFFTVREPFPTRHTGASLVFGKITANQPLVIVSQMAEHGVIFSDGIERDFVEFNSGAKAVIGIAEKKGVLIV